MKTRFLITIMVIFWGMILPVQADNSYIVIVANDGNIVAGKNVDAQRSIASITKIMTAVVALEQGDYIDTWVVGEEVLTTTGSMIWLEVGQTVSMRSLLYGLMLKSGNDAAVEIATRVGGSVEAFVGMMNEKAMDIGMTNTIFHNPHGLDVNQEGNYSTAYDMAILMQYAMQIPQFREIVNTQHYESEWGKRWKNSNKLLADFPFCIGGKTGYTKAAGETLVSVAKNGDLEFIIVTLNVSDRWTFHKERYQEVMAQYEWLELMTPKILEMDGYRIKITEAFGVSVTEKTKAEGHFSSYLDIASSQYILQWEDELHTVTQSYPAEKIKKPFCIWRWCW